MHRRNPSEVLHHVLLADEASADSASGGKVKPVPELLDCLDNPEGVVSERSLSPVSDVTLRLIEPLVEFDVILRLTAEATSGGHGVCGAG